MDKFNTLFDASFNLLEASKKNEESVTQAINELNKSTKTLNYTVKKIDETTATLVQRSSKKYAEIISNEVISKLENANKSAENAAKTYENAAKLSILKLSTIFFIFFLMTGALLWVFFIKEIPTIGEINNLIEERTLLEKEIYQLKEYGDLAKCGDKEKHCIKVDTSREYNDDDKNTYYVILPKQ